MRSKHVHELRHGKLVIRIREEKSRDSLCYRVSARRLYQNGDFWHESTSIGRDDIPLLKLLLDEAHTWILQQEESLPKAAGFSK